MRAAWHDPTAMDDLKGLILSGGKGTRLRPITHTSAKQLVPVANKPVLFYGLEAIAEAGITDVGIIVGDTAPAIEAAVGDGSKFGIKVTYIRQHAPLGLAHAVLVARELLDNGRTVNSTTITGYWKDTGNVTDMLEVNRLVLEGLEPRLDGTVDEDSEIIGRVIVEEGARVTSSRIVGPAIIGAGSTIASS